MSTKIQQINCLDCDAPVDLPKDFEEGEVFECEECGCEMMIDSVKPLKIDHAPEVEDDWGE